MKSYAVDYLVKTITPDSICVDAESEDEAEDVAEEVLQQMYGDDSEWWLTRIKPVNQVVYTPEK